MHLSHIDNYLNSIWWVESCISGKQPLRKGLGTHFQKDNIMFHQLVIYSIKRFCSTINHQTSSKPV